MERILIESAVRVVLLAIATGVVLRIMRITTPAARHTAWTVVLLAMLTMPVWTVWGPKAPLPVLPSRAVIVTQPVASGVRDSTAAAAKAQPSEPRAPIASSSESTRPARVSWRAVALLAYSAGVLVLLGRLLIGTVRAQRIVRRAEVLDGRLTSCRCSAPVTVGWIRPVVLLPEEWRTWSAAKLDAVLLHEHEHARRRDPLIQWVALLNRAIFWFHPMSWWLERQLAALAEDACDAAVISQGHQPAEYCEYLLSMARAVTGAGARVEIIGAAMPGAFLSERIRRILKAVPESQVTRRRLLWAVVVCAGLSAAVTAATLVPATARNGAAMARQSTGQALSEFWLDDDEWHLEVALLLTPDELRTYSGLRTTAERDTFIADFWRSHDPTPKTPANEFRREFERRIRFTKERYADRESAAIFGYQTDRGRWYVSVGPPDEQRVFASNRGADQESRVEEWRYKALDEFGGDVTVKFDLTSLFSCSWRGGRYRIESPAPLKRFEGVSSRTGAARRPYALTYPNRYVYLSFPIDREATSMKWELRGGSVDYVQGDLGESKGREPILTHLARYQFFEREGFACTEQLPAGDYTLSVDSKLLDGGTRADSVEFAVK